MTKNDIIRATKKVFPQSIFTMEGIRYTPEMENIIPYDYEKLHMFVQIELAKRL